MENMISRPIKSALHNDMASGCPRFRQNLSGTSGLLPIYQAERSA